MILKISYRHAELSRDDPYWFIIDNVARISYSYISLSDVVQTSDHPVYDVNRIIDGRPEHETFSFDPEMNKGRDVFILAHCHISAPTKECDDEYLVAFNTIGYLLNNDGKTLERLQP